MSDAPDAGGRSADGAETEALPGRFRQVRRRYEAFDQWMEGYRPYVATVWEVVVAAVLFVGYLYWLYLYFVVGA